MVYEDCCCGFEEVEEYEYEGVGGGLAKASCAFTGDGCVTGADPYDCCVAYAGGRLPGADIGRDVEYEEDSELYCGGGRPSLAEGEFVPLTREFRDGEKSPRKAPVLLDGKPYGVVPELGGGHMYPFGVYG